MAKGNIKDTIVDIVYHTVNSIIWTLKQILKATWWIAKPIVRICVTIAIIAVIYYIATRT